MGNLHSQHCWFRKATWKGLISSANGCNSHWGYLVSLQHGHHPEKLELVQCERSNGSNRHLPAFTQDQARLSRCSGVSIETGVSQVVAFIFVFILDLHHPERWPQEPLGCRLWNWKGHVRCNSGTRIMHSSCTMWHLLQSMMINRAWWSCKSAQGNCSNWAITLACTCTMYFFSTFHLISIYSDEASMWYNMEHLTVSQGFHGFWN